MEETLKQQEMVPEVLPKTFEGMVTTDRDKQHMYEVIRAEANASISGQLIHENLARLLRLLFLRETKEKLAPMHLWTKWCQEMDINVVKADDELEKLGKAPKELLVKFGSFTNYDLKKINKLTKGNFQNLEDSDDEAHIIVNGERIPLVKDEIEYVVGCIQENIRKTEEKAAKEKADLKKENKETAKKLKNTIQALEKLKKSAASAGISPEEKAFLEQMDAIKMRFTEAVQEFYKMAIDPLFLDGTLTEPMKAARKATLDYMRLLLDGEA